MNGERLAIAGGPPAALAARLEVDFGDRGMRRQRVEIEAGETTEVRIRLP